MIVSFDFDETLDRRDVQEFAMDIKNKGHEIYICTSRYSDTDAPKAWFPQYKSAKVTGFNDDLYRVADLLEIPKSNIIFTNMVDKVRLLEGRNIRWHLDNDDLEIMQLRRAENGGAPVPTGIFLDWDGEWKYKCWSLLEK